MFRTRLFSGIVLLAIMIAVVVVGGNILFATLFVVSIIGMTELYKVVGINKTLPGIFGYLACAAFYLQIYTKTTGYELMLFIIFLMLLMIVYVFAFPKFQVEQIAITFLGLFYVGVMISYIYQVRSLPDGAILVWLIFIGAWGSDTCAYCVGMLIGKHKIAPVLSPKKTVEGCVGGVVGAAFIGFLFAFALKGWLHGINNPMAVFALIGAASSVLSQVGDLAASAIKRNHEIKDYGTLIPGHGGILDRFDSIIFTAPIVYYLAELSILQH